MKEEEEKKQFTQWSPKNNTSNRSQSAWSFVVKSENVW